MTTHSRSRRLGAATPSREELVARARELVPALAGRSARHDADRRLAAETIRDLTDAGLFRILQPRRWGGYEMSPGAMYDVQMTLAEGDVSTAWVFGILSVHSFHLALFDDRAAEDVWGADDTALIASPYSPGRAVPVDGGYLLTGHWRFSSGSQHCAWWFLGGVIDRGEQHASFHDADYRTFLLPRSSVELVDTWHTSGLKGTGSNDILVKDAFVPEHRTHRMRDAVAGTNPGRAVNDGPLYRLPFWQVFLRSVSSASIGGLQGLADAFIRFATGRTSSLGIRTATDPDAALALAEAVSAVDEMKGTLTRTVARLEDAVAGGPALTENELRRFKFQSAAVPRRCAVLAEALYNTSGGSGVFATEPFARFHADLLAAGNHFANNFRPVGRAWGQAMMGAGVPDPVL